VLLSECHEWSAAPISACLRRGPRSYFRSECCTGGESMAAPRVNCFLAPIHQRRAQGWTGRKYRFSSLRCGPTGNRTHTARFGGACSTRWITVDGSVRSRHPGGPAHAIIKPCNKSRIECFQSLDHEVSFSNVPLVKPLTEQPKLALENVRESVFYVHSLHRV